MPKKWARFLPLIYQAKVRLVYQSSRLQCVIGILATHVTVREPVQFSFNERQQFLEGALISIAPLDEQLSDFGRRGHGG